MRIAATATMRLTQCWRQPRAHSAGGRPERKGRQLATLVRQDFSYVGLQTKSCRQLAADTPLTVLCGSASQQVHTQAHSATCLVAPLAHDHVDAVFWQTGKSQQWAITRGNVAFKHPQKRGRQLQITANRWSPNGLLKPYKQPHKRSTPHPTPHPSLLLSAETGRPAQ